LDVFSTVSLLGVEVVVIAHTEDCDVILGGRSGKDRARAAARHMTIVAMASASWNKLCRKRLRHSHGIEG
jgi:hypothetical protein